MKRNVFILALMLLFQFSVMRAAVNEDEKRNLQQQPVTAESLIKGAARIKSDQIDYAYISTAMFKQIFSLLDGNIKLEGNMTGAVPVKLFGSIKSIRRFATTGIEGYNLLLEYMSCFLNEDEEVLGMNLMAHNRSEGVLSVIYGDEKNLLVIAEDGNEELVVVFISGLSYDGFMQLKDCGVNLGF